MCDKSVLLFVGLSFCRLMSGQQVGGSGMIAGAQPPDGTCAFNFTSGSGRAQTRYCVTGNGNIAEFGVSVSPSIEFINGAAAASEGYGLCDTTNPNKLVPYFDYARTASKNWNPAVATLTDPTTVTVTRATTNGIWSLKQTIVQAKPSKAGYGAAIITMALTNLSTVDRFVILQRHVNVDAGGTPFNDFDGTEITTTALVFGNWGFSTTGSFLTELGNFNLAFNQTVPDGPAPCDSNFNVAQGFFQGDGSSEQRFEMNIHPGQTKTVTVTYRPI
jgi:hypothetical protein